MDRTGAQPARPPAPGAGIFVSGGGKLTAPGNGMAVGRAPSPALHDSPESRDRSASPRRAFAGECD
jgi:hypothetical protein